jgi:hypothetical protein
MWMSLAVVKRVCCDEPSAGRLATRSLDVLLKYASGSRGSACPSHNATA